MKLGSTCLVMVLLAFVAGPIVRVDGYVGTAAETRRVLASAAAVEVAAGEGPIEITDRQVRLAAGGLERLIDLAEGNVSTTHLRIKGRDLLAGPAGELSFTITRAEPNARPKGLAPGEGGTIDSTRTFRPGQHVDPAAYDDASLGQTTRWVEPVRVQAGRWARDFMLERPAVTTPGTDVSRLTLRARARQGRPLEGLVLTVVYEVYRGEPVVRKWVRIANESSVWRKLEQLTIDDIDLTGGLSERVPLTPAGYGVPTSMIGFFSGDGTFGVIAASEIPSALRTIADNGALGYHPQMFEWVLAPGEEFVSEPVFLYGFSGPVEPTISARSTPLDRTVEGPFQRFLSRHLGIVSERLPCDAPQWLTWANFGPNLNDKMIREQADRAAQAGFVQFLMDDGWQRDRLGTEPDGAKFPDFAATADYIRSRGLKLGLWLSCFRDPNSPDRKTMPEARSLPVVTRLGGVAMSFTTPWREFYAKDLARLHRDYGAVYFKQDFSNIIFGDLADDHPSRTRKESLLRGLRGLLEAQDRLRTLAPEVMNELTHEIYWDTPGAPCDLAALEHAARYHVSPNACRGIVPRPRPGQTARPVDPEKLRAELIAACYQARQIFYSHRGLPLYCLEFYGAATEDHEGSLTPEVQDRQVVSWLMGAPLVFSGDLSTLSPAHLAHYRQRFALVNRLQRLWDIYHHFQYSGVPAPTDDDWHWWGKLNDDGCGAVVVVRGSGGAVQRAINIPWVRPDRHYAVIASFSGQRLGDFTGRQLQTAGVELALPVYGQEILEVAPASSSGEAASFAETPVRTTAADAARAAPYLAAVRQFADQALAQGRDTYGKPTPLFVDGINVDTGEPAKWKWGDGKEWVLCNLASQQGLFRTLDGLTRLTGEPRYKDAALTALHYAFDHLRYGTENNGGLLAWGGHLAYNATADVLAGNPDGSGRVHELKCFFPYYELMWEADPVATRQLIENMWNGHILDWSTLDFNRHAAPKKLGALWQHEYRGGPVFFDGKGLTFHNAGSDFYFAAGMLAKFSATREPLVWAERLSHRYVETRDPNTGLEGFQFSQCRTAWCDDYGKVRGDRAEYQYGADFPGHRVVEGTLFPCYGSTPEVEPQVGRLLLGEALGDAGRDFTRSAVEELTAWGKSAYRKKDNAFLPMLTDGTSMEGYVCKKDGYFGPKGRVLRAGHPGAAHVWLYAWAYRLSRDTFLWEMARNIAQGSGWGDLGATPQAQPVLQVPKDRSDPFLVMALLELHRATGNAAFLAQADALGQNMLKERVHEGWFVPSRRHLFCRLGNHEAQVLLHLAAALMGKPEVVPAFTGATGFFHACYGGKPLRDYDSQIIYRRIRQQ